MGLFNIFKLKNNKDKKGIPEPIEEPIEETVIAKVEEPIELPEGELVSFSDEILDTDSRISIEKLKHNLEILMQDAKKSGKIKKFMIIRQDDFFPTGWEWRVTSKNTNLDNVRVNYLSYELKKIMH